MEQKSGGEPPMPVSPPYVKVHYDRAALADGRVEVTRVVHVIDRHGEKDTFVDTWLEEAA